MQITIFIAQLNQFNVGMMLSGVYIMFSGAGMVQYDAGMVRCVNVLNHTRYK